MGSLMLLVSAVILISSTSPLVSGAVKGSRPKPSATQTQYSTEDGGQVGDDNSYGSPGGINGYGSSPGNYGGVLGNDGTQRNGFGFGGRPQSDDQGYSYGSNPDTTVQSYPYPGSVSSEEEPNGVFSNPWLGQRRTSTPVYGSDENSSQPDYEGSYPTEDSGSQPGIYPGFSGYGPGRGQIFMYPMGRNNYGGFGTIQPRGIYGLGAGRGYGRAPFITMNVPVAYYPIQGQSGGYGGYPNVYTPETYGYGQYPQQFFPGFGLEYGRLRGMKPPVGNEADQNDSQNEIPGSTPSAESPSEESVEKVKSLKRKEP